MIVNSKQNRIELVTRPVPLQTMEDKIRIANKVNKKYKELLNDLDAEYKSVVAELGQEEVEALLQDKTQVQAKLQNGSTSLEAPVPTKVPQVRAH